MPGPPIALGLSVLGLSVAAAFRSFTVSLAGFLASIPRRVGARLFAMNDIEASWRGWQVSELRGGLTRGYHDPRFDLLRALRAFEAPGPGDCAQDAGLSQTMGCPASAWDDVRDWPWDGEG